MRQSPSRPYVRPILSPGRKKKGGFGAPPVILHTNSVSIACARAVNPSKLRIQHTGGGGQAEPAMMALRRTPLLPPGWGRGRPRHSSIGASSAAGAARGGAGLLLAVGGECVALQIAFCPLPHFLLIFCVLLRRSSRLTGGSRRRPGSPTLFLLFVDLSAWPVACVWGCRGVV